jgi:hypothetical protein
MCRQRRMSREPSYRWLCRADPRSRWSADPRLTLASVRNWVAPKASSTHKFFNDLRRAPRKPTDPSLRPEQWRDTNSTAAATSLPHNSRRGRMMARLGNQGGKARGRGRFYAPTQAESTSPKNSVERMRIRARFSPLLLKPTPRRRRGYRNRPGWRPPWSWAPHGRDFHPIIIDFVARDWNSATDSIHLRNPERPAWSEEDRSDRMAPPCSDWTPQRRQASENHWTTDAWASPAERHPRDRHRVNELG